MVGYDPKKINLTTKEQAYVSVGTSVLTRLLIQPFDVIKIRYQVQYEPISKKSQLSKYRSLTQSISTIVKEEGFFALWKGHLTGQVLSLSYNSAQFFWFELFTRYSIDKWSFLSDTENKKFALHFLCGGLAASCTVITNQPVDTIRTRLVTQGEPRVYNGIYDAIKKVYLNEGIKGFYRGTLPAILLVTPESAFRFGIYQFLNSHWSKLIEYLSVVQTKAHLDKDIGMIQSSVNGSLAGVTAKTIVYPFDLAKKRLQIQGFEDGRKNFGKV